MLIDVPLLFPLNVLTLPFRRGAQHPRNKTPQVDGLSYIRQFYTNRGFSTRATNIICASWRRSTTQQYEVYFKKWLTFCNKRQADPFFFNELLVCDFLVGLFQKGAGYSALNTARSALSTIFVNDAGITIGNFASVKRLLKGVFEIRPSLPRYVVIWDFQIVLDYLRIFSPLGDIPLSHLAYKLAMLVALASRQRVQTLKAIDITNITFLSYYGMHPNHVRSKIY